MAGAYNFAVYNGEDLDSTLTWYLSAGGGTVDLTDYTASLTMSNETGYVSTTSGSNGVITLGGAAGTIRLQVNKTALAQFLGTTVQYRLFMTAGSGETRCLLAGTFRVNP
jgi:hypothetical protein